MEDNAQNTKRSYLTNPDHVERAFRKGYLIGSRCAYLMSADDAMNLLMDICIPSADGVGPFPVIKKDETSSAFLRGFSNGLRDVLDWTYEGGDPQTLKGWLSVVYRWTHENPLSRKESAFLPPIIGNWNWNELTTNWINSHSKKGV